LWPYLIYGRASVWCDCFLQASEKDNQAIKYSECPQIEKESWSFFWMEQARFRLSGFYSLSLKRKQASRDAPKETADERARLGKQSHEWTSADKVGSLDISLDFQELQIRSLTKFRDQQALKNCR
jgi:hypothetical protein